MDGLIFLVMGVVVVAGLVYMNRVNTKSRDTRSDTLARVAADLHWRFSDARDYEFHRRYEEFPIFRLGSDRVASNLLEGPCEIAGRTYRVVMGDYRYAMGGAGGGTGRPAHFSFLLLRLPFVATHDLLVRPENALDRVAQDAGVPDINFESAEFSRRFVVRSSDKKFAYDVIHARMMAFLLAMQPPVIEIRNGRCLLREGDVAWDPLQFNRRLGWAREFFALWPDFLVTQMRPTSGPGSVVS